MSPLAPSALPPGTHHERVVDRHAGDRVDALGFEVVGSEHEARQVKVAAYRGEGTRYGEQHRLSLAQQGAGLDALGPIPGHDHNLDVRNVITDADHVSLPP
jgi:hypothetical protein